jgi:hypothetical protein
MQKSCCAAKAIPPEKTLAEKLFQYWPLIVVLAVSLTMATALSLRAYAPFMQILMGTFLCFLATLKLFNWDGFVETFAKYDVLAQRFRGYAIAYPLIEIALATLYLSGSHLLFANATMLTVMTVGTLSVLRVIRSGTIVRCACVGSAFDLPVGRVTLAENLVMASMAAMAIFQAMS